MKKAIVMDDNFFAGINQQFSEDQKQTIAQNVYSQLEDRVGEKLEAQLSDEQFEEFEKVIDKSSDDELTEWLAKNAPGYEHIVDATLEQLKSEVKADPAKFL